MPLPWAPKSLLSDTEDWSFTNSANRAMSDLATMGEKLMQPVGQQVRTVVEQAMPAPAPMPQPAPVTPSVPRFSLGKVEDWLTPAGPAQPAPQLEQPATPPMPSTQSMVGIPAPAGQSQQSGTFSLPSLESYLGTGRPSAAPAGTGAAPAAGGDTRQPPSAAALPPRMDTSSRDANLRQWAPTLRGVEARTGLRADALAAIIQAENGGGQSPLSANQNNYFSISNVGRPKQAPGAEGRFATYATPQDSLDDFVDLVSTSPRYAEAWANRGDPARFFAGLVRGGYIVPEPGFPVETWMRNLETGRAHYATLAPASATQAQPQKPAPQGASVGLDVGGITAAYKGVPYTFGGPGGRGQGIGATTDCSGFVSAVWKNQYGLDLPAHTDTSYNALRKLGAPEVSAADARPGDVVYYMGAGTGGAITHHMGLVSGPGRVLDMSTSGGSGVRERDIGHAGRYVILRDPRVSQQPAGSAQAPPPIVPSGVAEQSGGQRLSRQEINAASEQPALVSRTAVEAPAEGTPVAEAITATPQPTFAAPFQDEQREPAAPPEPESVWSAFQAVNGRSPTGQELTALVSRVYGGLGG